MKHDRSKSLDRFSTKTELLGKVDLLKDIGYAKECFVCSDLSYDLDTYLNNECFKCKRNYCDAHKGAGFADEDMLNLCQFCIKSCCRVCGRDEAQLKALASISLRDKPLSSLLTVLFRCATCNSNCCLNCCIGSSYRNDIPMSIELCRACRPFQ